MLRIRDTATHLGYSIDVTPTPPDFFDKLSRTRPDLIILDLSTGGIDSAAVLQQLKADPELGAIPLLGFTTHADWKRTGPLHESCTRVVTKDTLTRRLPDLIQELIPRT
jgi:CheY-like chemotaxis protein